MSKPDKGAPRIDPALLNRSQEKKPRIDPSLLGGDGGPTNPGGNADVAAGQPVSRPRVESTRPKGKSSAAVSLFLGLMLVPLSAAASMFLVSPTTDGGKATGAGTFESEAILVDEDLALACGPDGMALVALEQAEGLTVLQKAALDALRPICDQQGMPLPPAPVVDRPQGETIVVMAPGPAPASSTNFADDDNHDDDDHDDDDHDDDDRDDDRDEDDDDEDDD